MNRDHARHVIETLLKWGVAEFYVCAGARNIPLVETILNIQTEQQIAFNHFEERSAAFYALGRIKALNQPVAVVTTSGTAVAELLPAVMEAYYSGLPLVLITADRPRGFRGTGAPQSAEQKNIFSSYVSKCFDLEITSEFEMFSQEFLNSQSDVFEHDNLCTNLQKNKPVHINVCFDYPLQSGVIRPISFSPLESEHRNVIKNEAQYCINSVLFEQIQQLNNFIKHSKNLIIIISKIPQNAQKSIVEFVNTLNCPVYVESISNLRESSKLSHLRIHAADSLWENEKKSGFCIDSIIKIGGTPTHRMWRDLDETRRDIRVFSIHNLSFSGMTQIEHITTCLKCFFYFATDLVYKTKTFKKMTELLALDRISFEHDLKELYKSKSSETYFIHELSKRISPNSRVYLGNSLPIRHWDAFATYENKNLVIEASRGMNGIDGQISTFLGFADENSENWGIFGDLTTLYDLAGFWILNQRPSLNINFVIINNHGGKIFKKILSGKDASFVQNEHSITFEYLAKLWSLAYTSIDDIATFEIPRHGRHLLEFKINTL